MGKIGSAIRGTIKKAGRKKKENRFVKSKGMFSMPGRIFSKEEKDKIAEFLGSSPEALRKFEEEYRKTTTGQPKENFFDITAKEASAIARTITGNPLVEKYDEKYVSAIMDRIVNELVMETAGIRIRNGEAENILFTGSETIPVTKEELEKIPAGYRPMLSGSLCIRDIGEPGFPVILYLYKKSLEEDDLLKKRSYYAHFRQGLEIIDLDPVMYRILGMNRNSIGYWLPEIARAAHKHGFFKIPDTTVVKVPMPILQLTRLDYMQLNPVTLKIVDDWAMRVFGLETDKDYFVKTGVFSSKYDFRNAKVTGEKEVRELGEYLLFIQHQASMYASPLNVDAEGKSVFFYGAGTTNEFAVREYIRDKEDNPCIYNGMPLHTEYRVFVEFGDNPKILGVSPYWRPDVMKKRFADESDSETDKMKHDYVIYRMHEAVLMKRYEDNLGTVLKNVEALVKDVRLPGQWSLDIMQNGKDFYIIDMATADTSALKDCIPKELLKKEDPLALDMKEIAGVIENTYREETPPDSADAHVADD